MTMPNFLIIGAMKAGTTALYTYLEQHPQVYMSPVKEPNFFAFEGERMNFLAPQDQEGINRTSVTDIEAYRALFTGVTNEKAIGEASHWYLYSPKAPERIQHYIPGGKFIVVLRDPVERAYSQFLHFVRDGQEPLTDFAQALQEEETRIYNNWAFGRYASRGFYHVQLKRYFDAFDRSQIKVYLYEDLSVDPVGVLRDIFRFLEIDEAFLPEMSIRPNVSGVPKSRTLHALLTRPQRIKAALQPHLPARVLRFASDLRDRNLAKPQFAPVLRRQMVEMYREDILKLQDLIDRDLSKWLEQ
jgi:hypothetical protein